MSEISSSNSSSSSYEEEEEGEMWTYSNMQYDGKGRGKLRPGCSCSYCEIPSNLEYEGGGGEKKKPK